jgi:hypothetical protein
LHAKIAGTPIQTEVVAISHSPMITLRETAIDPVAANAY